MPFYVSVYVRQKMSNDTLILTCIYRNQKFLQSSRTRLFFVIKIDCNRKETENTRYYTRAYWQVTMENDIGVKSD